jgi:hypothetical protein
MAIADGGSPLKCIPRRVQWNGDCDGTGKRGDSNGWMYRSHQNCNRKLSVITTKWQSKTVELQNFILEQASHHFVFGYRKLDWQRVESAQILRMMTHLKF